MTQGQRGVRGWVAVVRLLLLVALVAPALSVPVRAAGITYTVDSTSDVTDIAQSMTPTGGCAVGHAAGACTLREALLEANAAANPGTGNDHTINFNIPTTASGYNATTGVFTITPIADPSLTAPVLVDGYSQPGASANTQATSDNAVLKIEVSGAMDSSFSLALLILGTGAAGSTIRGLAINRSGGYGIGGSGTTGPVTIAGNFIGLDPAGAAQANANIAVFIGNGATQALLGGTTPANRNVVSGNTICAVSISGTNDATANNTVQGNFLGLGPDGSTARDNANLEGACTG